MSLWNEVVDRDAGWQDITVRKGKDHPEGIRGWIAWAVRQVAKLIGVLITCAVLFAVACPILAAPILGVLWLLFTGMPWSALVVLGVALVGFGLWFWFSPDSFDARVVSGCRCWVRRLRYRYRWTDTMVGAKLTVKDKKRRELAPRITRVRQSRFADVLTVRLPLGLTRESFTDRLAAVVEGMGAQEARLVAAPARSVPSWLVARRALEFADTTNRCVYMQLSYGDPLVRTLTPNGPDDGGNGGGSRTADFSAVQIGKRDDGRPWFLSLLGTHILLAGATGSGKGSVLWSLLAGLGPAIRDGLVQVVGVDPKGGMELGYGRELFRELVTMDGADAQQGAVEFLEKLADEADRRASLLAGHARKLEPSTDMPFMVIVLDELASLTAFIADSKLRARAEAALGRLLTKGRAPGMCVIGAIQDPRKEVVKWRDLFPTRIALRLVERSHVDMVLGDGARERGAKCDHIPETAPGVGYLVEDGTRAITRVRAMYLSDADIRRVATTYQPGPVVAAPLRVVEGGEAA
ncbi:FtsK/SpoIIIE domain-containing protein [Sciscionella sediminilitoris]|uniref:FtsK/SpoIIIE domain-containing protein n=1 Tax=Sciscionella sediminilitoris TaxID=1445613 RepID=UPI00068BB837|nr:FtsK/SpoIIIE domain-containing protein [Sciscionella sp. SE31]